MYVRIARFEGGNAADIVAEAELIRRDIEAARRGETTEVMPRELIDAIASTQLVVDRQRGSVAILLYCDTEEKARQIDRIMDGMSPSTSGWGRRASADVYEVVVDEVTG
jgi:hypothetical protein